MSKDVGTPPGVDFAEAMSDRYAQTPHNAQSATPRQATRARERGPEMTRRSWLLPREVADALSAAADRIHHDSRGTVPKSAAQAALIRGGLDHEDEVRQSLLGGNVGTD